MKKINFYTKSIRGDKKEKQKKLSTIKRDFIYEINKPRKLNGLEVKYANHYLSNDKCWMKFAAGSNNNNKKQKINLSRPARLHWIFLIIDLFKMEGSLSKKYSNIEIVYHSENKFDIIITDQSFIMCFEHKLDKSNDNKPYYILLTAFPRNKKRKTD